MKSNLLCTLTLGVFLVCALYTIWLSVTYYACGAQLQRLQYQYAAIDQTQSALDALLNEALAYGKQHPAIEPVLEKFVPKPAPTNAPVSGPGKTRAQ
jgi:hypothetical protein